MRLIIPLSPTNSEPLYFQVGFFKLKTCDRRLNATYTVRKRTICQPKEVSIFLAPKWPSLSLVSFKGQKSLGPLEKSRFCARDHLESLKWLHLMIFKGWFHNVPPNLQHRDINPHQNDQGRKGPCFFQRLIALKCLMCKKIKKISNSPLGSYLVNEPIFWLIK